MAKKIVKLEFFGPEYEYEGLKFVDNCQCASDFFSGLDEGSDIEIYIDEEEVDDPDILEHFENTIKKVVKTFDWSQDVVGIRAFEYKSSYTIEIEVEDEFDPMKLQLYVVQPEFETKDDKLSFDPALLTGIIYDGKEYEFEDKDGDVKASYMIWGYDPEGNEDDVDEDDEEDNDYNSDDPVYKMLKKKYDEVYLDNEEPKTYTITLNDKIGLADANGTELIPPHYDWFSDDFSENILVVGINGKGIGFINKQGEEIIPLKYEKATDFYRGFAKVRLNGEYLAIDKNGEVVDPILLENVGFLSLEHKYWVDTVLLDKTDKQAFLIWKRDKAMETSISRFIAKEIKKSITYGESPDTETFLKKAYEWGEDKFGTHKMESYWYGGKIDIGKKIKSSIEKNLANRNRSKELEEKLKPVIERMMSEAGLEYECVFMEDVKVSTVYYQSKDSSHKMYAIIKCALSKFENALPSIVKTMKAIKEMVAITGIQIISNRR